MKINSKSLIIILSGIIILGFVVVVNAQQTLPKGGDDFESAAKLEPGNYEDFNLSAEETRYYKVTIKPGQLINLKADVKCLQKGLADWHDVGFVLYDQNRTKLKEVISMADCQAFNVSQRELSWMTTADDTSNDYYLAIVCKDVGEGVEVRDFSFKLEDYFDVGSTKDTANGFDNTIFLVESGTYTGYLGNRDKADYYKFKVDDNTALTAKVTPPSDSALSITIYDQNRSEISKEYPKNTGAIVTNTASIKNGGDVFIAIEAPSIPKEKIAEYDLKISTEPTVKEETQSDTGAGTETDFPTEEEMEEAGRQAKEAFEGAKKAMKTGIFAWFTSILLPLIVGFIIFIGIIVVIVVILKKKKKK